MLNLLTQLGTSLMERRLLPDAAIRLGIRRLCAQRLRDEDKGSAEAQEASLARFIAEMDAGPIAPLPEKANEQHYELPARFFELALGKHRKYSSCLWDESITNLDAAEERALAVTCEHAALHDGQDVLELGCGWGSLSLWMARQYPRSRIVSVSNSAPQRKHIQQQAALEGISNLTVITCDMNDFDFHKAHHFDRVVSVEMFEHMRNWRKLLRQVATCLKPDGLMFLHIFTHRTFAYAFDTQGSTNWLGRHFFTGGIMPSADLPLRFADDMQVIERWDWPGTHYEKTANAWLANVDAHRDEVLSVLAGAYGESNSQRWLQRWRIFFMACAELWGYDQGRQWGVSHYQLAVK